jgi:hypothetical protein
VCPFIDTQFWDEWCFVGFEFSGFAQVDENKMDKILYKIIIDNRTLTGIDWWWALCPQDG